MTFYRAFLGKTQAKVEQMRSRLFRPEKSWRRQGRLPWTPGSGERLRKEGLPSKCSSAWLYAALAAPARHTSSRTVSLAAWKNPVPNANSPETRRGDHPGSRDVRKSGWRHCWSPGNLPFTERQRPGTVSRRLLLGRSPEALGEGTDIEPERGSRNEGRSIWCND